MFNFNVLKKALKTINFNSRIILAPSAIILLTVIILIYLFLTRIKSINIKFNNKINLI